jgi:cation/acetate symporter
MTGGLALTLYYLVRNEAWLRAAFKVSAPVDLWFGILPVSAGVFGVPLGFAVCVAVSLLTPAPSPAARHWVRHLRHPGPP